MKMWHLALIVVVFFILGSFAMNRVLKREGFAVGVLRDSQNKTVTLMSNHDGKCWKTPGQSLYRKNELVLGPLVGREKDWKNCTDQLHLNNSLLRRRVSGE